MDDRAEELIRCQDAGAQDNNRVDDLIAQARVAFGWTGDIAVTPGSRGALGQMWKVSVNSERFALKEILDKPPPESLIAHEVDFARRAAASGLRVAASIPDSDGRYLIATPVGSWLRCHEWIDLQPVDVTAPDTPGRLGTMLARLHSCAPAATVEPDTGDPPDPWYSAVPARAEWTELRLDGAPWAARLRELIPTFSEMCADVTPPDSRRMVLCHRDLHPENVFLDAAGRLVVVDWDDFGPADPGQELARVLFDWFCDTSRLDLDAVRTTVEAYRAGGGPGRIVDAADYTLLLAHRLNFLLSQVRIALDPHRDRRRRDWADEEIDMMLQLMPTVEQLSLVLDACR